MGRHYGESEQRLREIFEEARQSCPAIVFIDEIDSLAAARGGGLGEPLITERVVNTILSEMDGLEELTGVVVIGATNRPNLVDPALPRPGRFDELVYVPVPSAEGQRRILEIQTRAMPLAEDVNIAAIAGCAERSTDAVLKDLVRRAGLLALKGSDGDRVTAAHFEEAFGETRASVTPEVERESEEILATLKQEGPRRQSIGFVPPRDARS